MTTEPETPSIADDRGAESASSAPATPAVVAGEVPATPTDAGRPRPLFVFGSPRSGTTLVGSFLASGPRTLNLGEYGGFHLAYNFAPVVVGAGYRPFRHEYLRDLADHARRTAESLASHHGCTWYCDSTPFNLAAAERLADDLPDALFVLMLRHYSGAVQSLRRSFEQGFAWAGSSWADSARVWADSYAMVAKLPANRTIAVSYETLCSNPAPVIGQLCDVIAGYGFDPSGLDAATLAVSHASGGADRPTIGVVDAETSTVALRPIPTFNQARWSGDIHRMVWPVVEPVHRQLQELFPGVYCAPFPPEQLTVHHEVEGLVPSQLGENW